MTKNQQSALRCLAEVRRWTVSPQDQGQIVEVTP